MPQKVRHYLGHFLWIKNKFTSAFKEEQVLKYITDHQSYSSISEEAWIVDSLIRRWVGLYKSKGILGLEINKSKTLFCFDFKVMIVKHTKSNCLSIFDECLKFNIPDSAIIIKWQKYFTNYWYWEFIPKTKGRPKSITNLMYLEINYIYHQ